MSALRGLDRRHPADPAAGVVALALLAALIVFEALAAEAATGSPAPVLLANAVVVDLALVGSGVAWWLGVRRAGWPPLTVVAVFLVGVVVSGLLVGDHDPLALAALEVVAVAVELGVLLLLGVRLRAEMRAVGAGARDPLELVHERVGGWLGGGWPGRVVASELAMLWFATASWSTPVPPYRGATRFGYGRHAGALYAALIGVSMIEVVAVHLLLSRFHPPAAWVLTALGLYGALWLVADLRATRLRPITLEEDHLVLRSGLRWTARVPLTVVAGAAPPDWRRRFGTEPDEVSLSFLGTPDLVLELAEPVVVTGPFGSERPARRIGVGVDEPERLLRALRGPS